MNWQKQTIFTLFDSYDLPLEYDMVLDSIAIVDADGLEIVLESINKVFKQVDVN